MRLKIASVCTHPLFEIRLEPAYKARPIKAGDIPQLLQVWVQTQAITESEEAQILSCFSNPVLPTEDEVITAICSLIQNEYFEPEGSFSIVEGQLISKADNTPGVCKITDPSAKEAKGLMLYFTFFSGAKMLELDQLNIEDTALDISLTVMMSMLPMFTLDTLRIVTKNGLVMTPEHPSFLATTALFQVLQARLSQWDAACEGRAKKCSICFNEISGLAMVSLGGLVLENATLNFVKLPTQLDFGRVQEVIGHSRSPLTLTYETPVAPLGVVSCTTSFQSPPVLKFESPEHERFFWNVYFSNPKNEALHNLVLCFKKPTQHEPFILEVSFSLDPSSPCPGWKDIAENYLENPLQGMDLGVRFSSLIEVLPPVFVNMIRELAPPLTEESLEIALIQVLTLIQSDPQIYGDGTDFLVQFVEKNLHLNRESLYVIKGVINQDQFESFALIKENKARLNAFFDGFEGITMQFEYCEREQFMASYRMSQHSYSAPQHLWIFLDSIKLLSSFPNTRFAPQFAETRNQQAKLQFQSQSQSSMPMSSSPPPPAVPLPSPKFEEFSENRPEVGRLSPQRDLEKREEHPVRNSLEDLLSIDMMDDADFQDLLEDIESQIRGAEKTNPELLLYKESYRADVIWLAVEGCIEFDEGQSECVISQDLLSNRTYNPGRKQLVFLTPNAKEDHRQNYVQLQLAPSLKLRDSRASGEAEIEYVPFSICVEETEGQPPVLYLRNIEGNWDRVVASRIDARFRNRPLEELPIKGISKIVYVPETQFYDANHRSLNPFNMSVTNEFNAFILGTVMGDVRKFYRSQFMSRLFLSNLENESCKYAIRQCTSDFFGSLKLAELVDQALLARPVVSAAMLADFNIRFEEGRLLLVGPTPQMLLVAGVFCKNNPLVKSVHVLEIAAPSTLKTSVKAFLYFFNCLTGLPNLTEIKFDKSDEWPEGRANTVLSMDELVIEGLRAMIRGWNLRHKASITLEFDAFNRTTDGLFWLLREEMCFQDLTLRLSLGDEPCYEMEFKSGSDHDQALGLGKLGYELRSSVDKLERGPASIFAKTLSEESRPVRIEFDRTEPLVVQVSWLFFIFAEFPGEECHFGVQDPQGNLLENPPFSLVTLLQQYEKFKGSFIIDIAAESQSVERHLTLIYCASSADPVFEDKASAPNLLDFLLSTPHCYWLLSQKERADVKQTLLDRKSGPQINAFFERCDSKNALLHFSQLFIWLGGDIEACETLLTTLDAEEAIKTVNTAELYAALIRFAESFRITTDFCDAVKNSATRRNVANVLYSKLNGVEGVVLEKPGTKKLTPRELEQFLFLMSRYPNHPYIKNGVYTSLDQLKWNNISQRPSAPQKPDRPQKETPKIPPLEKCQALIFSNAEGSKAILKQVIQLYEDITHLLLFMQGQGSAESFDFKAILQQVNHSMSQLLNRRQLVMGEQLLVVTTYFELQRFKFGLSYIMDPACDPIALVKSKREAILADVQALREQTKVKAGETAEEDPIIGFIDLFTGSFIPPDDAPIDPEMTAAAKEFLMDNLGLWLKMVEKYTLDLPTAVIKYQEVPATGAFSEASAEGVKSKSFPFSSCHTLPKTQLGDKTCFIVNSESVESALHGLQDEREGTQAEKAAGVDLWKTRLQSFEITNKGPETLFFTSSIGHQAADFLYNGEHVVSPTITFQGDTYRPKQLFLYHYVGAHFTCIRRVDRQTENGVISRWFHFNDEKVQELCETPEDDLTLLFEHPLLKKEGAPAGGAVYRGGYIAGLILEKDSHRQLQTAPQELRGLPNYGNTCFINTALHALASMRSPEEHRQELAAIQVLNAAIQKRFSASQVAAMDVEV